MASAPHDTTPDFQRARNGARVYRGGGMIYSAMQRLIRIFGCIYTCNVHGRRMQVRMCLDRKLSHVSFILILRDIYVYIFRYLHDYCWQANCTPRSSSHWLGTKSPTRRGLGGGTTWRLYFGRHPHESPTPTRIKHNVQQRSPWKQI